MASTFTRWRRISPDGHVDDSEEFGGAARHAILGGLVQLYKRKRGPCWQCSASVGGQQHRATTREESLGRAKDFAQDWYLDLRGKLRMGELIPQEPTHIPTGQKHKHKPVTFREAAAIFEQEYDLLIAGDRNATYVQGHKNRLRVHLVPFFDETDIRAIKSADAYRMHRMTSKKHLKTGAPIKPARSTLHQEIVTLRQVMKMCFRKGWIDQMPDLSAPYRANSKVSHRGWFSPDEYKQLYTATRDRAENPKHPRWVEQSKMLHDLVLFLANTGLRPDEAMRLEHRDVSVVIDDSTSKRILEIEVRGKRGVGFCKSMPGAVQPFIRLQKRSGGKPTARLFEPWPSELFKTVLKEENLRQDREGQSRSLYSLRHSYICFRLMEGADIYQVAKNCRTSVEMIEKHYASHLKNTLDASAINVRKPKRTRSATSKTSDKSNRSGEATA